MMGSIYMVQGTWSSLSIKEVSEGNGRIVKKRPLFHLLSFSRQYGAGSRNSAQNQRYIKHMILSISLCRTDDRLHGLHRWPGPGEWNWRNAWIGPTDLTSSEFVSQATYSLATMHTDVPLSLAFPLLLSSRWYMYKSWWISSKKNPGELIWTKTRHFFLCSLPQLDCRPPLMDPCPQLLCKPEASGAPITHHSNSPWASSAHRPRPCSVDATSGVGDCSHSNKGERVDVIGEAELAEGELEYRWSTTCKL